MVRLVHVVVKVEIVMVLWVMFLAREERRATAKYLSELVATEVVRLMVFEDLS